MTIRIAVNGPGRIGRSIVRAIYEENFNDVELVAINSSAPLETLAHLLRYDSVHGRFNYAVEIKNQKLFVNNKEVIICNQRDPKKLPWKEMNIDLVFECTGAFTSLEDATMHIESTRS